MVFTYYLLRDHIQTIDDAVSNAGIESAGYEPKSLVADSVIPEGTDIAAFYKAPIEGQLPVWAPFATSLFSLNNNELESLAPSFLIFLKTSNRIFCIPFGRAYHHLTDDMIEPNFGQQITLNKSIPKEIRRVKKHAPGRRSRTTDITRYYTAPVLDIAGRFSTDILKEIEGKVDYQGQLRVLGGLDSLHWLSVSNIEELDQTCKMLLEWYGDTASRPSEFKIFESYSMVRSASKKQELFDRMFTNLTNGSYGNINVISPNFRADEPGIEFRAETPRGSFRATELTVPMVGFIAQQFASTGYFLNQQLAVYDTNNTRRIVRSIVGYLSVVDDLEPDWIYCLSEGEWYRLSADISERLNKVIDARWKAPPGLLPGCHSTETEPIYNKTISKKTGFADYVCLDKATIPMAADGTGTEACDILTPSMHFISVKVGTTFDVVSYVCAQALVSAQSFRESQSFRDALKLQITTPERIDEAYEDGSKCQFVIALITRAKRDIPADMSYNCKLQLEQTLRQIEELGFPARIYHIPYI